MIPLHVWITRWGSRMSFLGDVGSFFESAAPYIVGAGAFVLSGGNPAVAAAAFGATSALEKVALPHGSGGSGSFTASKPSGGSFQASKTPGGSFQARKASISTLTAPVFSGNPRYFQGYPTVQSLLGRKQLLGE